MGVFAEFAPVYAEAGLAVFPVNTRAKKPAVRNWQQTTVKATRAWMARLGDADGLGVCMGGTSRLVEVDVDAAGPAPLAAAIERFGDTPIVICTPSDKHKLWFRDSGEGRRIRPLGALPVDILGGGFTIAPPSYRPDLGRSYGFIRGSLADLDRLPTIRAGALDMGSRRAAEAVQEGQRNDALFLWCMAQSRFCDDADALLDVAQTWADRMPMPLDPREVERTARRAWRYQVEGRNFVGLRCPQVDPGDKPMDDLSDAPDAFWLLHLFQRYHTNKPSFVIAPGAMSRMGNPPWHVSRIRRARDVLIERGLVSVVEPPDARKRRPGLYRLIRSESVHNHCYTLPPSLSGLTSATITNGKVARVEVTA